MSEYVELYKKYRPQVWEDLVGQEKAVESLRNAVIQGKTPSAYLFLGTHGCGKTSSAFILAKALNCENLKEDGNPCNECDTCKSIDNGTNLGVVYESMANSGKVDELRKLMLESKLKKPVKKSVYILDEIHSISRQAFDSLLIPLEEAQQNSLFIFCSTEPEKIINTVLSRVQVRNFRPVGAEDLAKNLKRIIAEENLTVSNEDLIQIIRSSNGSVRDSVRNLETLTVSGELPSTFSMEVLKLLNTRKYTDLYKLTSQMAIDGQSFRETAERLYSDLSSLLIMKAGGKPPVLYAGMKELSEVLEPGLILKYLKVLGETLKQMSLNLVDSRILFEIGLFEIITIKRKYDGGNK